MIAAVATTRIESVGPGARWMRALAWLVFALLLTLGAGARAAEPVQVLALEAMRSDEGIEVDFALRVALPPVVEDAVQRGVPLYFVARASVYRPRWYWRDERLGRATRSWRLTYQPLTSSWRVSQGGLHQSYGSLPDALLALSRLSHWKVADASRVEPDARYYVEFSWRLDTTQLPSPMQIGIGGQADWSLGVERTLRLERASGSE